MGVVGGAGLGKFQWREMAATGAVVYDGGETRGGERRRRGEVYDGGQMTVHPPVLGRGWEIQVLKKERESRGEV